MSVNEAQSNNSLDRRASLNLKLNTIEIVWRIFKKKVRLVIQSVIGVANLMSGIMPVMRLSACWCHHHCQEEKQLLFWGFRDREWTRGFELHSKDLSILQPAIFSTWTMGWYTNGSNQTLEITILNWAPTTNLKQRNGLLYSCHSGAPLSWPKKNGGMNRTTQRYMITALCMHGFNYLEREREPVKKYGGCYREGLGSLVLFCFA